MKKIVLFSAVLLLSSLSAVVAQQVVEGNYGKKFYDVAYSAAATSDGGYVITGLTMSGADTLGDIVVIKVGPHGDSQWSVVYGGPKLEGGNAIMQTADGGYLVSGHTEDYGAHDCDAFMMKLNAQGQSQWIKVYGGEKDDIAEQVIELPDGGFVMAAITESYGNTDSSDRRHVWLLKTKSNGDTVWTKCYAGRSTEYTYSIAPVAQGGYLAAGWTTSRGNGEFDGWLLRLNENGDTLWTSLYKNGGDSRYYRILPTYDGGFMLAGFTAESHAAKPQGLMVKLDANGREQWRKTYGSPGDGYIFNDVAQLPDGSYLFTGTNLTLDTLGNVCVVKTTENGEKISDEIYGGSNAHASAVAVQGNNSYLIAGVNARKDPYGDLYYMEIDNTVLNNVPLTEIPSARMYPNPVKDKACIILPASHANQFVTLDVLNSEGRVMYSRSHISAKDLVIAKGTLPAGSYLFRVTGADGKVFKGKFVME